jgi:membrane associated rhomboid family serine protease
MLKILIITTVTVSLLAAYSPELQAYLALTWAGLERLYLWQPLTYLLVEPGPLSFSFLLQLAFNMYLLWMFGTGLIERSHPRRFLLLYLGAGLAAALAALAPLYLFHGVLAGTTGAVYAIMVAWMMLNPHSQLLLFFALPIKAHWLIVGVIGLTLFLNITHHDWVSAASLIGGCLYAYLFTLIIWREQGPFAILRPFERNVLRRLEREREPQPRTKIYDIKSGAPVLDDDAFMDTMLDKISKAGENSLTPQEKQRMHGISERKHK